MGSYTWSYTYSTPCSSPPFRSSESMLKSVASSCLFNLIMLTDNNGYHRQPDFISSKLSCNTVETHTHTQAFQSKIEWQYFFTFYIDSRMFLCFLDIQIITIPLLSPRILVSAYRTVASKLLERERLVQQMIRTQASHEQLKQRTLCLAVVGKAPPGSQMLPQSY